MARFLAVRPIRWEKLLTPVLPAMLVTLGLALSCARAAGPVLRVVRTSTPGVPLLRNVSFEESANGKLANWNVAPKGYHIADNEGRNSSAALACENASGNEWRGASQVLVLNRAQPAPLRISGWSKAQDVSGGADTGYSLYVDLLYTDGTPLWGQSANFSTGTHDWQRREFLILPEKPIKSLTLYCLFRGHSGKVWFDDIGLEEVTAPAGAVLFQGAPVLLTNFAAGLTPGRGGPLLLLARDVAANSDFFSFDQGKCPELGLKLELEPDSSDAATAGRVLDTAGKDRAITLVAAVPVDASGGQWWDDIRRSRIIQAPVDYLNASAVRCGAVNSISVYPLAAVESAAGGLALGIDMARPAHYRLGYHAGLKLLYLAYDLGLVQDTVRLPGGAAFRWVRFEFPARGGFRAAWAQYISLFPEHFRVRSPEQGLWMPFTDVSKVPGWEDFGFRYHEGNNNVPWDDAHGVLSFRYTEPMTWWMRMPKETPRTTAEALRIRDELAENINASQRQMAKLSIIAAMHDETARPGLLFRNEPWCDGAVWSLNPNPHLSSASSTQQFNAATVHWNDHIKVQLYGPAAKGRLDGEYLDSLEGYVTADLNFRRDHFRDSTVPLTFTSDTFQPALFKGLAVFEFTKWLAEDMRRMNKLLFANGVPYRFSFLCPWLDVLGTETDWLNQGQYRPSSLSQMDLWRTMSGGKPYLLLMNTDYDRFTPDLVERYFQRCLFYGMWPGFFSHNASDNPYFLNPKWYERDRPLFRKYLPSIRRLAEAGWQPLTQARCDNPQIQVERFGPGKDGTRYLSLYNDTPQPQSGILRLDLPGSAPGQPPLLRELLSNQAWQRTPDGWQVTLQPAQAKVVRCESAP